MNPPSGGIVIYRSFAMWRDWPVGHAVEIRPSPTVVYAPSAPGPSLEDILNG
jgi:hypothetical protein